MKIESEPDEKYEVQAYKIFALLGSKNFSVDNVKFSDILGVFSSTDSWLDRTDPYSRATVNIYTKPCVRRIQLDLAILLIWAIIRLADIGYRVS